MVVQGTWSSIQGSLCSRVVTLGWARPLAEDTSKLLILPPCCLCARLCLGPGAMGVSRPAPALQKAISWQDR